MINNWLFIVSRWYHNLLEPSGIPATIEIKATRALENLPAYSHTLGASEYQKQKDLFQARCAFIVRYLELAFSKYTNTHAPRAQAESMVQKVLS